MPITLNGDTGITTPTYNGADTSEYLVPVTAMKNRIINGAMMIDQRNAGASVTPTANDTYTLDRFKAKLTQASKFSVQQNAGSVTPPIGFTSYLGVTSLSAYSVLSSDYFSIEHDVEGLNIADLGWGTSNAQAVTLSFWVRSSLTGGFSGTLVNSAYNRNYGFSYTINSANTWEQKTITIAGDTSGTWLTTSGVGIRLQLCIGSGSSNLGTTGWSGVATVGVTGSATSVVGTNGATFYITGVQLEKGSTATSFDYRPYGTELALCQRYYEKSYNDSVVPATNVGTDSAGAFVYRQSGLTNATNLTRINQALRVSKRATPSITTYSTDGTSGTIRDRANSTNVTPGLANTGIQQFSIEVTPSSATTSSFFEGQWVASAEL